jgi:DNA invertase Pin-like site-specific DNA recombinase
MAPRRTATSAGPKAVGYVRVSTQDQAREGWSLDAQRRRIEAYCVAKGWPLVKVYADEGVSAVKHRPQWEQLRTDVLANGITHVVAMKLDRFGRSAVDLLNTYDVLERKGVALVCVEDSIDTSTPAGRLMRTVLAAVAEFERDVISQRTKDGLAEARAQGKVLGAPVLIADAVERRIRELRAQGMTVRAIAEQLTAEGVPTVKGGPWNAGSVYRVLQRLERSPEAS